MKQTSAVWVVLFLCAVGQPAPTQATVARSLPSGVLAQDRFVPIARDCALLDGWLAEQDLPNQTLAVLREQNHAKILALHEIDQKTWRASRHYYLEESLQRAVATYAEIYQEVERISLEAP